MVDLKKAQVPVTAVVGAAGGMSLGIFVGEVVARMTGLTGAARFGVKALVKIVLAVVLNVGSGRLGGLLSFGVEIASYAMAGSIIPDAVELAIPGGLAGAAELIAVSTRAAVRKVPAEGERKPAGREQETPAEVAASLF